MRIAFLISFLFFLFPFSAKADLAVNNVRIGVHPDKTRLVIEMSRESAFRSFTLSSPERLVVDLPSFSWQPSSIQLPENSLISDVRRGALSDTTGRLVFDLKQSAAIQAAFILPANAQKHARLVIDFNIGESNKIWGNYLANESIATPDFKRPAPVTETAPEYTLPTKEHYTIVLDAGHGGQDPGANRGKILEKHITLALVKTLKKELEAKGNFTVHLTRNSDKYIKLYDRVKIARSYKPDLFVSLHADAIGKSNVRGASIYTLSEKASDAQTAKLAARENKADLIAGIDLSHEEKDVANILLDLAQRDTMNQSNFLAERLAKSMKESGIRMLENPHRSAGFAVLKAPDIPSILIEAGFISNAQEAKLLNQESYRQKIAATLAEGLEAYLKYINNP